MMALLTLGAAIAGDRNACAQAPTRDPIVYAFWAESCPHSQRAISFIHNLRKAQPAWKIRDYEVEKNPANAAAHARVLDRIGIAGISVVPLIVVGEYAHIGFEGDETSGKSILGAIERCRQDGCPDRIGDLIAEPSQQWAAASALARVAPASKPTCSGLSEVRVIAPAAK